MARTSEDPGCPGPPGRHDADLITIGLVTDLHYAPGTLGSRYCDESLQKLTQAADTFRCRSLDLIINLGDSLDTSTTLDDELRRLREMRRVLESLNADVHYLVGNHDVSELSKDAFMAACGMQSSYYSFDCGGAHLVVLDSNFNRDGSAFSEGDFCWNDAWIGERQIEWLERDLNRAREKAVLVFCHANLDICLRPNGSVDRHVVRDAERVRDALESHGNVKAVIHGHRHRGGESVINGIPYLVLQAMVDGSGLAQNAYGILTLTQGGAVTLEGYGQQPSMCFAGQRKPSSTASSRIMWLST